MSPLSAEPTNIVGVVGAVATLSLMAVLTISGLILYYNPLLCLRGRSSPPRQLGQGFIQSLTLPSFLERCPLIYPSPSASSCSQTKSLSALEELGWKRRELSCAEPSLLSPFLPSSFAMCGRADCFSPLAETLLLCTSSACQRASRRRGLCGKTSTGCSGGGF